MAERKLSILHLVCHKRSAQLNADLLDRAKCIHPKLKIYQLVVSGRDWCNLYEEIKQKQIEHKQELALKAEEKTG